MNRRILAIFAHPDDEAFGPGGTLAKYAHTGTEIHLLMATRGEAGQLSDEIKNQKSPLRQGFKGQAKIKDSKINIDYLREREVLESAKILGIKRVEFLGFKDGTLNNNIYHKLADKIIKKINDFKPQIVLTNERRGISGHLDHIAVSMITTYSFLKTTIPQKLYYNCLSRKMTEEMKMEYFVYFPEGYDEEDITTKIDYQEYNDTKIKAMMQHKTQMSDVKRILARNTNLPKVDNFILQYHRRIKIRTPETDLFEGVI